LPLIRVPVIRRFVQRSSTALSLGINVGAAGQKQFGHLSVSLALHFDRKIGGWRLIAIFHRTSL
jgi:hypothetical protein